MAGIIDIKAKPSPPAELIIGLTLVSHGPMRFLIWPRLDAAGLPNKLSRVGAAAAYLCAAAAYLCAAAAYLIYNDNRANSASWAGLGLSLAIE